MADQRDRWQRSRERPVLVAGIGCRAADPEPVELLAAALPANTGIACVLVGDGDRDAWRHLCARLRETAALQPVEAREGQAVAPDRIYLAPAGVAVVVEGGRLHLRRMARDTPSTPIDDLLRSVARDCGDRAVGIVLADRGGDGTLGLKTVSEAGGATFAQPHTDAADEESGAVSVAVDHVLPVADIAVEIERYAKHRARAGNALAEGAGQCAAAARLHAICTRLREQTGHDFSHYKHSTLVRRIRKRMRVLRIHDVDRYVEKLDEAAELDALSKDLLISVTGFFRDPEAFAALRRTVLPRILERGGDEPFRIWVPGCATGEEVYSIAILVRELLDGIADAPEAQIFGTDIDERALATARRGRYPKGIESDLSPARLERFFERKGASYAVTHELRELCLFSPHNLVADPPFARMDLISCRNLMIYLGPQLQAKLVPLFHFALRPGGCLFLGMSESIADHEDLFEPVDGPNRILRRRASGAGAAVSPPSSKRSITVPASPADRETQLAAVAQRVLLDEFAPRYAIVNEDAKLLYVSEGMSRYLEPPRGSFSNNIVRMARLGLRTGLRTALRQASRKRHKVVDEDLSIHTDAGRQPVTVTVQPMPGLGTESGLFIVAFADSGRALAPSGAGDAADESAQLIARLERELEATRADLETTVQELEAANEELNGSNEELLSTNEELQSANEELQIALGELRRAKAERESFHASTGTAAIALDEGYGILSFTPAAAEIYNLIPGDVGRPIAHITHRLRDAPPLPSYEVVRDLLKPFEDEVASNDGAWFVRRVLPYRDENGRVAGAVLTFNDVTELRASESRFRAMAETVPDVIFTCDAAGGWDYVNPRLEELTGRPADATCGEGWIEDLHPQDAGKVREAWRRVTASGDEFELTARLRARDGRFRWFMLRARPLRDGAGRIVRWLGTATDIHDQKRTQRALERSSHQKDQFLAMLAHELRNPLSSVGSALEAIGRLVEREGMVGRMLDIMDHQVGHMARLLDDLLDVSRVARGKIELRRERVDLVALLLRAQGDLEPQIAEAGLTLQMRLPSAPLWVHVDPARVAQVVGNLITNAVKYTPAGGRIELQAGRADDERASITVRDTGVGMDRETLGVAFEPFQQADDPLDRAHGGLGLGLALVRGLVELHGGEVEADSEGPGAGTEVIVRLPCASPPEEVPSPPAPETTAARRILLIDDSAATRDSLQCLLELEGHQVATAVDGAHGMEVAARFRPEVVLCDIGLPGAVNGFEVARRLRARGNPNGPLLIAVSGYGQERDRRNAREAGFDLHLTKPAAIGDLREAIARCSRPADG